MSKVADLDHSHLWHPFTQQQDWCREEPLEIERAEGTDLIDVEGSRYIDGVSSLWCNLHGHRHPLIDQAVQDQLERVAHSTMLGLTHRSAAELASRLVEIAPPGLSRVFYSDSGSTATEVALKMAFQYWQQRRGQHARRTSFVSLRGAYHGDTLGAVSVGGIGLFHSAYSPLLFETHHVAPGDAEQLECVLDFHSEEIAAVIVEPLVQGAAGIQVQPHGYLRRVRELCDRHDVFLICDEVATGFGRTGTMFACEQEGVAPDFLCLAKGLTGGYLPLAATLATEEVFAAFLGPYEEFRSFFHGHTYTGNPLGCAVGLASLAVFREERTLERLGAKIARLRERLAADVAPLPHVGDVRQQGMMVGIELVRDRAARTPYPPAARIGQRVVRAARAREVVIRPLGGTIVLMPPLAISAGELDRLVDVTRDAVAEATAA
jgi:adenosylmethionine---8-amino-7-oxononanoate aminotransferase